MHRGYIKFFRKYLSWEWRTDIITSHVFLNLLVMANWNDGRYKGMAVKRGQLIRGRKTLSEELGISEQQLRTALTKLKSTSEVTSKSTSQYTIYTIVNYDLYQCCEEGSTSQPTSTPTNEQPTSNQRATTIKEGKEGKEGKEDNIMLGKPNVNKQINNYHKDSITILEFLNEKTGRNYKPVAANLDLIKSRLKDGATIQECRGIIAKKWREWKDDDKMRAYARPSTLFNRTKFAQYQGELGERIMR